MYYEYRIRKISDNGSLPSVEFLLLMIYKHLLILGIDMQPGFKSEQIQEKIRETLPEIPDGLYLRVNDLMENISMAESRWKNMRSDLYTSSC